MNGVLPLLSLLCVTALVAILCALIHRVTSSLRSAERSVRSIADATHSMLVDGAVINSSVETMNHNLYRVAMHLSQLGDGAENLTDR